MWANELTTRKAITEGLETRYQTMLVCSQWNRVLVVAELATDSILKLTDPDSETPLTNRS